MSDATVGVAVGGAVTVGVAEGAGEDTVAPADAPVTAAETVTVVGVVAVPETTAAAVGDAAISVAVADGVSGAV